MSAMSLLAIVYFLLISLSGLYLFRMVGLSMHARLQAWKSPEQIAEGDLPSVTVQLPLHNETAVVRRLLDAVCSLDYPPACLQIQVLNTSTDQVSDSIEAQVRRWQERGVPIDYLRLPEQSRHKAEKLAYGLSEARGELIAIFDADFMPEPGWLRQAAAHFVQAGSENLGLVQTRWSHINAGDSFLTRAENLTNDHFSIVQATRTRLGLWSSFYGSAGLWRRACIEQAGGWSGATLTEDLDLAYRAQLAGWRLGYENSLLVSAELPASIHDYKRQQYRWARGNTQVMRLLWKRLLSGGLSPLAALDAILFATWPANHLLTVLMLLARLLLIAWPDPAVMYLDALVAVGLIGPFAQIGVAALRGERLQFPFHILLGTGISLIPAGAMLAGLASPAPGEFEVTPKGGAGPENTRPEFHGSTLGETALALAAAAGLLIALGSGQWLAIPLFLLDTLGFGWIAALSWQETGRSVLRGSRHLQPGSE